MSVKQQIDELTGLRGIAAACILINHIVLIYPILRQTAAINYFSWFGHIGMDLFFILSGFVICYNYAEKIRNNPKTGIFEFLVARIARLYPLYLAFILFFLCFNMLYYQGRADYNVLTSSNLTSLPIFLTGMQSWFFGFIGDLPVIHLQGNANISWSISTEFALYLFFIPLVWLLLKINSKKAYIISIISLIIIQLLWLEFSTHNNFIVMYLNKIFGTHSAYTPGTWLNYHSPIARVWQFLCGCVIARSYNPETQGGGDLSLYKSLKYLSILGLIVAIVLTQYLNFKYAQYIAIPLLVFWVFAIVHSSDRFLKSKPLIFMGEVSYSTYLLHIIFVPFLCYGGKHAISYIVNAPILFIVTYIVAFLVYKYYEMPMRKKVKDFLLNR